MKIKHFSIHDTPEQLKAHRNRLWKKHHPDKFPDSKKQIQNAVMAEINAEYDYLAIQAQTIKEPLKEPVINGKFNKFAHDEELKKHAQNIFNSITKDDIDYSLLFKTIKEVKNWKELFSIYAEKYGISMIFHIVSKVKNKKKRDMIIDAIVVLSGNASDEIIFKAGMSFFKNIFKF